MQLHFYQLHFYFDLGDERLTISDLCVCYRKVLDFGFSGCHNQVTANNTMVNSRSSILGISIYLCVNYPARSDKSGQSWIFEYVFLAVKI